MKKDVFLRIVSIALAGCLMWSLSVFSSSAVIIGETIIEEDEINVLEYKESIMHNIINEYGENGILPENLDYSWDYNNTQVEFESPNSGYSPDYNSGLTVGVYSTHGEIIDDGNDSAESKITPKYLPLVKKICQMCDTQYGANKMIRDGNRWVYVRDVNNEIISNENYCRMFHGKENYIGALNFLWRLAKLLIHHQTGHNMSNDIDSAIETVKGSFPRTELYTADDETIKPKYVNLFSMTKHMLLNNYSTSYNANHTEAGRCKYIIYGCIMHLIGDLSAHRIIIPVKAIETFDNNYNGAFNSHYHFLKSDFINFDRYDDMVDDINNQTLCFSYLRHYNNGIPGISSKYIDNPDFYPQRVNEAVSSVAAFLDYYHSAFNEAVIMPVEMTLHNFEYYQTKMGLA